MGREEDNRLPQEGEMKEKYLYWIGGRLGQYPLVAIAILTLVYLVAAKLGLTLAFVQSNATAIWPPTGIAIAALLLFGHRLWPGIFVGAFLANITTEGTVVTSLGIALGNTLEAVTALYLLRRFSAGRRAFEQSQNVFKFLFFAGMMSTALSATIGVISLSLGGFALWSEFWAIWFTWWIGDAGGALIITPAIVLWMNNPKVTWDWRQRLELVFASMALILVSRVIFGDLLFLGVNNYPVAFLSIPILAWIAVRFSQREIATANVVLAALAVLGTLEGFGPFAHPITVNQNSSLLFLQAFLTVAAVTSLVLASIVAERRRVERALHRINQVKNNFLAVLAHELRNPLAPIVSYIQLMQLPTAREFERKQALDGISVELKNMTRLLDDLLDISRITKGRIKLEKEMIDLRSVVARAVESASKFIDERNHVLKLRIPRLPIQLEADPTRVEQIVVNLLNNAAKYTDPHGTIWLTCGVRENNVTITVRDTGIGIPPEMLSHIFDMFNQVDRSTTRAHGGLGIGLRLVKVLAGLHGGSVVAKSDGLGTGSTFTVLLPLRGGEIIYNEEYF